MMIKIPIKPISVNRLFQGRRFKTREYDKFREMGLLLAPKVKMVKGNVTVKLDFYSKNANGSDVDNFLKGALDLIVEAGYIQDDRFIQELTAGKFKSKDERIEVEIKKIN